MPIILSDALPEQKQAWHSYERPERRQMKMNMKMKSVDDVSWPRSTRSQTKHTEGTQEVSLEPPLALEKAFF